MKEKEESEDFVEREKVLKPFMVDVYNQDRLDSALKKLKRMVKDGKVMVEYQKHQEFKKKSQSRREKRLKAKIRNRRMSRENI